MCEAFVHTLDFGDGNDLSIAIESDKKFHG
jgi:hypothetical protein